MASKLPSLHTGHQNIAEVFLQKRSDPPEPEVQIADACALYTIKKAGCCNTPCTVHSGTAVLAEASSSREDEDALNILNQPALCFNVFGVPVHLS